MLVRLPVKAAERTAHDKAIAASSPSNIHVFM
jgi:hypothetical protein